MKLLNVTHNNNRKMQHSKKTAFTLPGEIIIEFSFMLTAIVIALMELVPFEMNLSDICKVHENTF